MHAELIAATGGSSGIRDEALLDAALAAPFISFGIRRLNKKPHASAMVSSKTTP